MREYKNFFLILAFDIVLFAGSFYAGYLVRFDFDIPYSHLLNCIRTMPYIVIIKAFFFSIFDLYKGMWRYTGIVDLINIIKASSISTLIIVTSILFYSRFIGFPRSVFLIDFAFTILFISGFRLIIRFYFEIVGKKRKLSDIFSIFKLLFSKIRAEEKRIIIIGAGDCGEKIYREIDSNPALNYRVIGFLDDNPIKKGKKIHGVPVLGGIDNIIKLTDQLNIKGAIIAVPSASSSEMRRIVSTCEKSKIDFKIVPSIGELIDGKITINSIREVIYKDLLGREDIVLDQSKIGAYLTGKSILITGAGGSIGSELCKQICRFGPKKIILFERAESPLYEIDLELKQIFSDIEIIPALSDIQDISEIERVFLNNRPQVVFHAAAYKHVPMLELQPWKAITNNIFGTLNIVEASKKYKIDRFVFVSTDKAVRPVNVMGASKRVAEMLVQNSVNAGNTHFMTVRFGNVAGSVGSVIPLFKKQIKRGGPVTVTHPKVTRYFMTISEACQLILQAGALSDQKRGEIYILDMGTPIRIYDMARDLIRLSGFEPDEDIAIEYIGLRPGEKLSEELITDGEGIVPTSHKKIMVLEKACCSLDNLNDKLDELIKIAHKQDSVKIRSKLQEIIPEYKPLE